MDEQAKKKALRMISYGLYVITVKHGEQIAAGTVNWLSQCSFKPPLIMVGLKKDSGIFQFSKESKHFTVNVLGKNQKEIAQAFFGTTKWEGNRLNSYEYETTSTGGIVLKDCPAFFEAQVHHIYEGGDHSVVVAEVVNAGVHFEDEPLYMLTTGWFYGG
ncbi:MAG: flavin reductase family protein [Leptospiraceae bacterium]|nr:flavin reductase family protein [Leptospiraceae bacterium]MDW7974937.1 flavin reductase family protein [Leptospiraceae bacterium]